MYLQTHFTYFSLLCKKLKKIKIYKKKITNFNYILFSFIFFMVKLNIRKLFSLKKKFFNTFWTLAFFL